MRMHTIREQTGQQLDTWRSSVTASHLPELESFAKGIQQDKAAVLAGLTWPWSTGPVEGYVNRLKLLKRSMYGRAKLPQLASTSASYDREGAFSRSSPGWIVMRLTSRREQVREQNKQMGNIETIHDEPKQGGR
jgi:Transposase